MPMCRSAVHANRRPPMAFTLIEALVALTIMAIASSALLLSVTSSLQTTATAEEGAIALGMAQQLMDEVTGTRYAEYGEDPRDATLGPESSEATSGRRKGFDDIDDYNLVRSQPPVDRWGIPLGQDDGRGGRRHPNFCAPAGFFDRWRQEVNVYYVSESDTSLALPPGSTSDCRAIEVRIVYADPERGDRELARLRRVVNYVPPL